MSNELALYPATTQLKLKPSESGNVPAMMSHNKALKNSDVIKIEKAYAAGLYDMTAEFIWNRTINILKQDLSHLGTDFIAEMLDRPDNDIDNISAYEIINLSADLGILNETARMEFLQYDQTIKFYLSNDEPDEEYPKEKLIDMIRSCIIHVLCYENIDFKMPISEFRNALKKSVIDSADPMFKKIKDAPYFFQKTLLRSILNLSKTIPDSAERENVLSNMIFLIPEIWNLLSSKDKWTIGRVYASANNEGDASLSKALRRTLLKTKGFDYVPENLRSNSYINVANQLLSTHMSYNNFYNEPSVAKKLMNMGTSIPIPALAQCMTAILACKLGNSYGISEGAQAYLDKILQNISQDRWEIYLNQVFPKDSTILLKLTDCVIAQRFVQLTKDFKLDTLNIDNSNVQDIFNLVKNHNIQKLTSKAKTMWRFLLDNKH